MRKAMLFLMVISACAAEPTPTGGSSTPGGSPGGGSNSNPDPGGGGNPPPSGGGSMTATQYLAAMDMKYCDEAFTCQASFPTTTGDTFADEFGASASECYSDSAAYEMPAQVEAEITAGKIHYDAAAAQACVSGLTFGSCTDFWNGTGGTVPTECDTALVGTVADGGACVVDYDCSNVESVCDPTAHTCGPEAQGSGA
jgi:hypothetical protein